MCATHEIINVYEKMVYLKSVNNSNVCARLTNGCECARLWYLNRHTDFVRALSTILYAKGAYNYPQN